VSAQQVSRVPPLSVLGVTIMVPIITYPMSQRPAPTHQQALK
jgi:hypothetical protein